MIIYILKLTFLFATLTISFIFVVDVLVASEELMLGCEFRWLIYVLAGQGVTDLELRVVPRYQDSVTSARCRKTFILTQGLFLWPSFGKYFATFLEICLQFSNVMKYKYCEL